AYTHPQPHACFIQNVDDDLVNEGGIFDLVTKEARLFKYGSGTGTNFSKVRGKGEPLAGGGASSGLMSFLKVLDSAAGSIKSGGTTRRAAKMVILDVDHPEIEEFISWKVKEEQKVAALVTGSFINHKYLKDIMVSAEENGLEPEKNPDLKKKIAEAKRMFVPLNLVKRVLMMVENGVPSSEFTFERYDTDFRSEAYYTVDGQNSNNSVRVTNEFLEAVERDKDWNLINRVDDEVNKTIKARDLWDQISNAAWMCADPGIQYHTTVNEWHTCPQDGEIRGSNPCSEYMFLDETACNLYQINLGKFYDDEKQEFDRDAFQHCVRLSTIILEVSVLMSQLPSKTMAEGTSKYRTLGLGFANAGSLLMRMGLAYDSEEGAAMTGSITAIMTGESYATSAEMAAVKDPFVRYEANKDDMLRVMRNHRRAAYNVKNSEYEGLTIFPQGLDDKKVSSDMVEFAQKSWDAALKLGEKYGYRNAQASCLAPTGTTGLVMDCDTTGLEPDFALVKFKKLVGGGYFKIINQSIEPALRKLGYTDKQIDAIIKYAVGHQTLENAPYINHDVLEEKGFTADQIEQIEVALPNTFEIKYAFTKWTLGEEFCKDVLGLTADQLNDNNLNILAEIGFSEEEIEKANEYVCGTMTIEGAPYLRDEHLPVFDCANKCGAIGTRYISVQGHIRQMAAAQPFLSGAISKTINMPEEVDMHEVKDAYMTSWKSMIKANALYRDGSKLSQPLNTSAAEGDDVYAKLFRFEADDLMAEASLTPERVSEAAQKIANQPIRKKLPIERHSITHKFEVGGHKGFITVGLYENGTPGEIFVQMNKQGSTLAGIMDAWATSVSFSLQYGVPLEEIIRKLVFMRFEPAGMTKNPEIPMAQSIMDYIGRWLAVRFLDKEGAKQYHNEMLVDKSYESGTNKRILIPFINGKGHTEIRTEEIEHMLHEEIEKGLQSNQQVVEHVSSVTQKTTTTSQETKVELEFQREQQQLAMKQNNDDAPLCAECGSITVRNGACYKCTDCGSTTGCS
ncbi:adenosylcobalamin-dependent ribonucleoside-diphosphate reductase, partial [Candidatus Dojkabacteria bacterium]|nr:adenosylcobalamin-dependent ribonucleoside-diphosphate reductase [Candidatus Dojkabacteria bacterium]